jgi:hypothetical protein
MKGETRFESKKRTKIKIRPKSKDWEVELCLTMIPGAKRAPAVLASPLPLISVRLWKHPLLITA